MTTIEKVTCFPNDGTPQVIAGSPVTGDLVRITTASGAVVYERYTAPATYVPQPIILSKKACRLRVITALMVANSSSNSVARARMQALRIQVDTLTVTTDAHRRAKGALEAWREDTEFSKIEFQTITNDIDGGTDMSDNERDAILGTFAGSAAWPEA